jgi:transposase
MRGTPTDQETMFSYVPLEARIPADHPLRAIRAMTDEALSGLSRKFDRIYEPAGRRSIPPEYLLRALVIQILYSVRSERLLMEQIEYNLLFRWFVGLPQDEAVWDVTVFTKNRDRLLKGEVAEAFFGQVSGQARAAGLLSDEHFTVDGTLLEACAGQKSFRPKDEKDSGDSGAGGGRDFHGERRTNETHASTTDDEARLYKKGPGKEAKLCYLGHVVADNRHGLLVGTRTTLATGTAEREAAEKMLRRARHAPRGLRDQPVEAQARRAAVRLDEDRGADAQAEAPRPAQSRVDLHLHGCRLQPGPDENSGPRSRQLIRATFPHERLAAKSAGERVGLPRPALSFFPSKAARSAGSRRFFAAC